MTRHTVPGSHCIGKVHSWVGNWGTQMASPPISSQTVPALQRVAAHGLVACALADLASETHWACCRNTSHFFSARSHSSEAQACSMGTQIWQHCPSGMNSTSPGEQNRCTQRIPSHGWRSMGKGTAPIYKVTSVHIKDSKINCDSKFQIYSYLSHHGVQEPRPSAEE